ncbi:DUF4139 domain-containing protein [Mitsuaria sp. 7]|uniref:DUF4139 domain-containing protein n=1 Tax=Mitsuaria sp. 7 TaxID=1658665 RepID=UPI0007DD1F90|nr:DUF4139 domain-containing protein [Mitsuaria sp. 7]ANH70005.1 hypothetical protein ABE85_24850 [Mitsuaria sp. 7]
MKRFDSRITTRAAAVTIVLGAALGGMGGARAQGASAISQVLLYPGGAQVERTLTAPAGTGVARFACLSPYLERDTLQAEAAPGVSLGDLQLELLPVEQVPECQRVSPRIKELEQQRSAVDAEMGGVDLALKYLRSVTDRDGKPGVALNASVESLRRSGQELLTRERALQTRIAELEQQLRIARAAEPALSGQVGVVLLRLSSPTAVPVKLSYRVRNSGWTPQYRGRLDTAKGTLTVERLARVAQGSGEDWNDVRLRLSTEQPRQAIAPRALSIWRISMAPPPVPVSAPPMPQGFYPAPVMSAPAPAAPPPMFRRAGDNSTAEPPVVVNFDASVFQGEFAAEYALPQPVTLRGNGQELSLTLGQQTLDARLIARVQPQIEAQAYLFAEAKRPAGAFPNGPMQLYRDGSLIGSTPFRPNDGTEWTLPFGTDDWLRVDVSPEQRDGAETGLIATRRERVVTRQWAIENRRTRPVTLQVLEAAPVGEHADIRVQTQFSPAVTQSDWNNRPGVQLWELPLEPGRTQRFSAVYRISVPRDANVLGLP